ncbi:MAG TPA: hypothetical protein VK094_09280 [Pseudogracilibacillus sp.]|nr:hypothetical protein [Pseudogracilibacillus sp.]
MTNNVIPIPVSFEQRQINEHGEGYVECAFTEKWLQFPEIVSDEKLIPVKVMAKINGEARQVTQLILNKEDLLRAAESVKQGV